MPRVRWEEQLCVSCEFVTKFAVYGFFAEHSSAVMTARYTGEIPLDKVQEAFSKMELENMEVIGKRPLCTSSRLVVYNQQTRGKSGRRTMAV